MAEVQVRGLQELGRTLDLLASDVQKTAIRKSTAAGLEVYRREIRARAPVREVVGVTGFRNAEKKMKAGKTRAPGYLKRHIGRWITKNSDGSLSGFVGPMPSAFYGRFVEQGHNIVHGKALSAFQRRVRQTEFGSARVAAKPFLRPAFESKTEEALNAFADEMKKWLKSLVH